MHFWPHKWRHNIFTTQQAWSVQCLELYHSVLSAFPTPHLSSVIVSSFLWYLHVNYASLILACGRISVANTGFGIFFLFSVPSFLMLVVSSVWASLSCFLLGWFFFLSPCSVQDSASCPAMSLLLSILRFAWGPGFRSFCSQMFFFMMLQVEYSVNGHTLCVLTYWMFTKAAPLASSYGVTKCLCLLHNFKILSPAIFGQMLMDSGKDYLDMHASLSGKPSNPNRCCGCFCPHRLTSKNQNVLGRSQTTSHNDVYINLPRTVTIHYEWRSRLRTEEVPV